MSTNIKVYPITDFTMPQIKKFDSGEQQTTEYFHRYAKKNHITGLSPCQVMIYEHSKEEIVGYVTLSSASIKKGAPPEPQLSHLPKYPIPVTLIGRLAIHKAFKRQGLGTYLLMHVFYTFARSIKELHLGSVGIIVDAINQDAVDFYAKYDFELFLGQESFPKRMFISKDTILDAISLPGPR